MASAVQTIGVTSVTGSATDFESVAGIAASVTSNRTPLPLTTLFTAPASCSQIVTWDGGHNFWQYGTNQTGGDCYPPDFKLIYNSFYTPGVCPEAWTSAGQVKGAIHHDAMCCPRGYFLSADTGYFCASIAQDVLTSVYSTSKAGNAPIGNGASFTTIDANHGASTVIADVIQVQWQNKDKNVISLMAQKTATSGKGGATIGAKATAPTPSSTSISRHQGGSSSGMSTGAKIGIGVAVPIIVLSLLAMGFLFFLRQRRRRAARQPEPSVEAHEKNLHELSPQDQRPDDTKWDPPKIDHAAAQSPQEMDAQDYNELPADGPVNELGGQQMQRSTTYKSNSPQVNSPRTPASAKASSPTR